ncbi:putative fibroin-3 related protein [Golovinomyces cichoracearum]|uniref:Putative fibroin-3 related protein n=1 Tax=Golovinomyces cichoracearum TaxID=62708 RepID=A0A420ISU5_9PEZI|nr:putative fibroin-3 related protein [Golovinomyces cichoracearum]
MPSISAPMPNSLFGGEIKNIATTSSLQPRLIGEHVSNFKNSINTWDKCMSQTFCKWPVITGIVIGLLIVLSILTCITRCLCCGYSCCCSCFSFLNCCGCKGCCDGKRYKSSGHEGQKPVDLRNQGYVAPGAMMSGGMNSSQFSRLTTNTTANKPLNEDALPAMPSWDTATSVHVLDEDEVVNSTESADKSSLVGQKVPLVIAGAPTGMSSPSIQRSPDSFSRQPALSKNSGYRSPIDPNQYRTYDNMSIPPSPIPNSEQRMGNYGVGYRSSPTNMHIDEYEPRIQNPNQNAMYAPPPFTPNRLGSPGPGKIMPGRAYQSPQDQGSMMGYQGYRA